MSAVTLEKPHFSVAMDWKARTIEQWLEQYGSWLLIGCRFESLGTNSIMGKLKDMANGVASDGRRRALPRCNITDEQAEAIEALINFTFQSDTKKARQWLLVLLSYHVDGWSEETTAARLGISRFAVTRDKMLGIVRLVSKHSYLRSHLTD